MKWVNVYASTRHYGGPEEGGWWYNWDECVASVPFLADTKEEVIEAERYRLSQIFRGHGSIYSVASGVEYWVEVEEEGAQSETKERPYYE